MPEDDVILNIADPEPTPDQEDEWERERKAAWEAKLAPFKKLRAQIEENTEIIAEHDELHEQTLYELSLLEMEE